MRIATWNLERPKASSGKNTEIIEKLKEVNADILILTETHSSIDLREKYAHSLSSDPLLPSEVADYKEGENRTTIWSKHPMRGPIKTFDSSTSICACVQTPRGELNLSLIHI